MKCYPTECLVTCTTHTYEICQANVVSYKRCLSEHQNYGPSSHMGSARSRYLFITIHRSRSLSRFWKDNKRIENNRSHIRKPLKGDCKGCVSWLPMMDDKGQKKRDLNSISNASPRRKWPGLAHVHFYFWRLVLPTTLATVGSVAGLRKLQGYIWLSVLCFSAMIRQF